MNDYTPPIVTVDAVLFQLIQNRLYVLLIERANEPFKGAFALPGGYNAAGETTLDCLERVIANKAGVALRSLKLVEQLYTFDTVARDPRGHAVSITYMGYGKDIVPRESSTTQSPGFFPIDEFSD